MAVAQTDTIGALSREENRQVLHRRMNQLRAHYLEKQHEATLPWKSLIDGAAIIAGVAVAILSGLAEFSALFLGIGAASLVAGLGRICLYALPCFQKNQNAADAIISPGFYEHALQNPRSLATADNIQEAYHAYARGH